MLYATLLTWPSQHKLDLAALVSFTQSVLEDLPSSSSPSQKSANLLRFGEVIVDVVWAVDSELDEVIMDAKAVIGPDEADKNGKISPTQRKAGPKDEQNETAEAAVKAKSTAEADKLSLANFISKLLVCSFRRSLRGCTN